VSVTRELRFHEIMCGSCNHETRTGLAMMVDNSAIGCFARLTEKGEWEKGCRFDSAHYLVKSHIETKLLPKLVALKKKKKR